MAEQLSGQAGRQGRRGKPVLYVLIASVALMLMAFAGLMVWQGANSPPDYASRSQAASREQITGSGSGKADAPSSAGSGGVPGGNPAYPQPAKRDAN